MAKKKKLNKDELARARENGLIYTGQQTAHINGIPARDLFVEEALTMSDTQLSRCVLSHVYEISASPILPVADVDSDEQEAPEKGEENDK